VAWDVLTWNEGAIALYDRIGARPVREWIRYSWEPSD
jgi:RimJ/RimL family protein N-acetyltransferase